MPSFGEAEKTSEFIDLHHRADGKRSLREAAKYIFFMRGEYARETFSP